MWTNTAADDKQPDEKKAAELKGKYEKDTAAYSAKGSPDAAKKGVIKAEKNKNKKEEEDEEEEEDEDEKDDDDEQVNSSAVFFLSIKHLNLPYTLTTLFF
ncbi:High mobility group protein B1 (Fragment) [Lemmus lemmus]